MIYRDHGATKEPMNPYPEGIHRFRRCTLIQTDLGSLIGNPDHPKGCNEIPHEVFLLSQSRVSIAACNLFNYFYQSLSARVSWLKK